MRALVLHPVRQRAAPRPEGRARRGREPRFGARSRGGRSRDRSAPADAAGTLFGKGKVEEIAALVAEAEIGLVIVDGPLSPGAAAQPREGLEGQGPRPHRADPGDLRRPGADPRGRAAGRARPPQLPEVAAGALLDPPRAAARRLRLPRRPRRDPDRGRPPALDERIQRIGRRCEGGPDPRPAPQRPASGWRTRWWRWSATPTPASRRCSTG